MDYSNHLTRSEYHTMYTTIPNLVIGFHGCDQSTADDVLHHNNTLNPSENNYDWLGNGVYFWENNLERAWEWAEQGKQNPKSHIKTPAVIGAVIDLGYCLNLLDSNCIQLLKDTNAALEMEADLTGAALPVNKNIPGDTNMILRKRDCAVIQKLHSDRKEMGLQEFDSVRAVFFEGAPIYDTSGFMEQSHIQICIRNPNCIKGFFAPRKADTEWRIP